MMVLIGIAGATLVGFAVYSLAFSRRLLLGLAQVLAGAAFLAFTVHALPVIYFLLLFGGIGLMIVQAVRRAAH